MKDRLADFVRQNRQQFDDRKPPARLWKRIESSLGFGPSSWNRPINWWRAAAIFFMALSVYLLIPRHQLNNQNAQAMKDFLDVEAFYVQQISHKVAMIQELNGTDGLNGFTHDFEQLEAMYLVLKEEMKTRPSEKVKDAMVLNLLVRIDLLNQHLQRLEEKEVERDDSSDKQRST